MGPKWTKCYNEMLQEVNEWLAKRRSRPIQVLEAGGGSATFLADVKDDFSITTIDISPEQLAKNTYAQEKILGDLERHDFSGRRFDLIVCWDVLEHLGRPESAIAHLAKATDGLVIVKGPVPQSMKGLVTSLSPHIVHVLFYRWVLKSATAGQVGFAPFKTEHATAARPEAIEAQLRRAGFRILSHRRCEGHSEVLKERSKLAYLLFKSVASAVQLVTIGRYGSIDLGVHHLSRKIGRADELGVA